MNNFVVIFSSYSFLNVTHRAFFVARIFDNIILLDTLILLETLGLFTSVLGRFLSDHSSIWLSLLIDMVGIFFNVITRVFL